MFVLQDDFLSLFPLVNLFLYFSFSLVIQFSLQVAHEFDFLAALFLRLGFLLALGLSKHCVAHSLLSEDLLLELALLALLLLLLDSHPLEKVLFIGHPLLLLALFLCALVLQLPVQDISQLLFFRNKGICLALTFFLELFLLELNDFNPLII